MRIEVRVKPNAPKTRITSIEGDLYHVDLKAQPQDGKANLELIKFLSRHFKKDARIITGKTSKRKVVQLD